MPWYYAGPDAQPVGPVSVEELHARRLNGTILPETYVIEHTGHPQENWAWKHYREVFPTNLAPVHPPLPPPVVVPPVPPPAPHPLFPSAGPSNYPPVPHSPTGPDSYYKIKPTNKWCGWGFGLAFASCFFSLFCGIGLFLALPALFFSIVGLAQVHKNREQAGVGLGIAGLCLSSVALLISLICILYLAIPIIKAHEQTTTEQTSNDSD
jgi:hypothetical protein